MSGKRSSARRLTTGRMAPRRLASPSRLRGTIGIRTSFGRRMISATAESVNPNDSPPSRKINSSSDVELISALLASAAAKGRPPVLRVCWRLLAIAALDGFSEGGDLFDRGGQVLSAAGLLLGSSCCLGRGGGGLLGD